MHTPSNYRNTVALLGLALLLVPLQATADVISGVAELLTSIDKQKDESYAMLRSVLGDFVVDPFKKTDDASGSLLAGMFKDFNMFIFSASCLWMAYNMMAGLAQTMHEGVVLGKRMSTVWMPIRIAFGTISLMPIFGGWAFCQALMVIACLLGIAGANRITNTAISNSAAFAVTVNPMGNIKQAAQLQNVEIFLATAAACQRASRDMATAMLAAGQSSPTDFPVQMNDSAKGGTAITVRYAGRQAGGSYGASACGEMTMQFSPRSGDSSASDPIGSTFGFRIKGINYTAIRQKSMQAHANTIKAVYAVSEKLAVGASPNSTPEQFDEAVKIMADGYFGLYTNTFQAKLAQLAADANGASNSSAISDELTKKMKEGGWATLGIWYAVFAETNEAMNEMLDPVVTFVPISGESGAGLTSTDRDTIAGLEAMIGTAMAEPSITTTSATGNTSIGQWIMGGVLNGTMGGSSTGASWTINPILAFKNIGDNGLAAAQALYFASKVVQGFTGGDDEAGDEGKKEKPGFLRRLAGKIPVVGGIANTLSSIASDAGSALLPVAFLLFCTSCVMAFYIPMIPFIQWFAALIQWFTSVIESLIGSSLWMMAHFDSDGEGMGQRTSYGYVYMLNNFARPIIMTFAFFIASATITVLGTFLFKYFGSAVASSQGNSLTGLLSIVAYLVIFTVMGLTLINSTFSMMLQLADRMIGWIGSNHTSAIGDVVENKVNAAFINAARSAGSLAQGKMPKADPNKGLVDSIARPSR